MGLIRDKMLQDLQLRNYADRTIDTYLRHARTYVGHFMVRPDLLEQADVEEYLLSDDPPFDLVREADDGELAEFACARPMKGTPPQPV